MKAFLFGVFLTNRTDKPENTKQIQFGKTKMIKIKEPHLISRGHKYHLLGSAQATNRDILKVNLQEIGTHVFVVNDTERNRHNRGF